MCTHVDGNSCFVHNIGGKQYREYTVLGKREFRIQMRNSEILHEQNY